MMEGQRAKSDFLFLLILVVLSAAAIWFVEWERPRRGERILVAQNAGSW